MRMRVYADELRSGDVVFYCGRPHRITQIIRRTGWAWPVADDGTGWAIALDHHVITIER